MQYRQEKKRTNLPKSYELALLYGKAKWRLFNTASTPCDSFAPIFTLDDVMPPADRCSVCSFGGFGDIAFTSRTSKLDDSLQHRNILYNVKQFNVQLERLIFCKAIRRNATPFVCMLYHSTLRWTISHNAAVFVCTLYHSTLRWAISRYATPFVHKLCYSTLPWAISRNTTPFVCALCYSTLR